MEIEIDDVVYQVEYTTYLDEDFNRKTYTEIDISSVKPERDIDHEIIKDAIRDNWDDGIY